jgi:hypothetical protein
MRSEWTVQRSTMVRDDGQHRWDTAYQCLLQWATQLETTPEVVSPPQEDVDASRNLRPGLDDPSPHHADHRAAD